MRFIRHLRRLQRAGGQGAEFLMSALGQKRKFSRLALDVRS